jgi:hypothetical protein
MPSATRPTAFFASFAFLAAVAVAVAGIAMLMLGPQASASASHAPAHATYVAASSDGSTVSPADLTWG